MIKEALEYLIELRRPALEEVNGRKYSTRSKFELVKQPKLEKVEVCSLEAFAELVKKHKEIKFVLVQSPDAVVAVSDFDPISRTYDIAFEANRKMYPSPFPFGQYLDQEEFVVALQSKFEQNELRDKVLLVSGTVTSGETQTHKDDGVTQEVVVKSGAALVQRAEVPNPVELAPFRTFAEVDQPESKFILRVKQASEYDKTKSPKFALFEADGGAWKLAAMKNVYWKLKSSIEGVDILY